MRKMTFNYSCKTHPNMTNLKTLIIEGKKAQVVDSAAVATSSGEISNFAFLRVFVGDVIFLIRNTFGVM